MPERPFEQKSLAPRGRRGARLDLAVSANRGAGHGRAGDPRNAGGRRDAAARGRAGARHHCAAPALAGAKRAPVAAGCPLFSEGGPPARRGAPLWIAGAARAVESWTEQQKRAQTVKRPSSDGWCVVVGVCRRDPVGPRRAVCAAGVSVEDGRVFDGEAGRVRRNADRLGPSSAWVGPRRKEWKRETQTQTERKKAKGRDVGRGDTREGVRATFWVVSPSPSRRKCRIKEEKNNKTNHQCFN